MTRFAKASRRHDPDKGRGAAHLKRRERLEKGEPMRGYLLASMTIALLLPAFAQDVNMESDTDDWVLLKLENTGSDDKNLIYMSSGTPNSKGLYADLSNYDNYAALTGAEMWLYTDYGGSSEGMKMATYGGDYSDNRGLFASAVGGENSSNYGVYASASGGSGSFAAAGFFNGQLWRVSDHYISDQKLKTNVRDVPDGLPKVMALKPRLYEMRTNLYKGKLNLPEGEQIGFIAQEVETVLPQLVSEGFVPAHLTQEERKNKVKKEPTQLKGVDYTSMIPILVKAIQEQQALIEALQAEVAALKK
jgi:hypothetical protein